jgi:glucose/arabinose dehydrogenase
MGCVGKDAQSTQSPSSPPSASPSSTPSESPSPTSTPALSVTPTPAKDEQPSGAPEIADAASLFEKIIADANALLDESEKMGPPYINPVTSDDCLPMLGLEPEDFSGDVDEAYVSNAAIMTIAHEIALIKCSDADAAARVKRLIASGFNSGRWICVFPDRSLVIEAGEYVMLAATGASISEALVNSFVSNLGGAADDADVFYTKPAE